MLPEDDALALDTPAVGSHIREEVVLMRHTKRMRTFRTYVPEVVDGKTATTPLPPPVVAVTPQAQAARWSGSGATNFRPFRRMASGLGLPNPMILSTPTLPSSEDALPSPELSKDDCGCCDGAQMEPRGCSGTCCGKEEKLLSAKFAKLKSPTKVNPPRSRVSTMDMEDDATALLPVRAPSALVPPSHGTVKFDNGTVMTHDQVRQTKTKQRSSQGLYSTTQFFPTSAASRKQISDEDRTARSSLIAAPSYICEGNYGCKHGDCLSGLVSADVLAFRTSVMSRRHASGGQSMKDFVLQNLTLCYNRTEQKWTSLTVHLDEVSSAELCPASFALLAGSSSSLLRAVAAAISSPDLQMVPKPRFVYTTAKQRNEKRGLHFSLLRAYVAGLLDKHEANPAPGAHQPGKITSINRQTWSQKWDACERYFQNSDCGTPGSQTMLKRAWKLEDRLKEKRACSHSKCTTCSRLSAQMEKLSGVNTAEAKNEREFIRRAMMEHEKYHLDMRIELDQAGLTAIVDRHFQWTIVADAATQRNFLLPKFSFRTPKDMARRPFWSYKLMATYAYGYGFTPYLVHDSQTMGANLTWTVIWLTLCDMRDKFGFWPHVLHITLDNTTGENKNETLVAMCAWLVSSGKVKQVRAHFLPVGHTHIVIDHIFGVITVGLRRTELLVPSDLVRNIDATLASNPQYMAKPVTTLHCLFDFKSWATSSMEPSKIVRLFGGDVQDADGPYTGMYDLLFKRTEAGEGFATLQYREHCSHPWLPEGCEGVKTITAHPMGPPKLQQIKSSAAWSSSGTFNVRDTITMSLKYARTCLTAGGHFTISSIWDRHFTDVPSTIELLRVDLRLVFRHFSNDDVLRLGVTGGTTDDGTEQNGDANMDQLYEAWKRNNVDVRICPLAIDPVVSSFQSVSEYEKAKAALQAALRVDVGPVISASSPLLLGDYLLIKTASQVGVTLGSVQNVAGQQSPYSSTISGTAVLYAHTPNAQVSGMFGTFKQMVNVVDEKRQQVRVQITRADICVYNVSLTKTKHLTLASLRALSMSAPELYPLPATKDLPESHLHDQAQKEGQRTARAAKKNQAAPGKAKPTPGRKSSIRSSSEDSSDDSSLEDSSLEEPEEEEEAGEEDEGEEDDDPDEELGRSDDDSDVQTTQPHAAAPSSVPSSVQDGVLLLGCDLLEPQLEQVVAFNMADDPQFYVFKYPVGFAFVTSCDPFKVGWFTLPETQLAPPVRRGAPRGFKIQNKFLTLEKEWLKHDWWKDKRNKPSIQHIMEAWLIQAASKVWLLPLRIPQPAPEEVKEKDKFKLPMAWVLSTLIPACEAANCLHTR